MPKVKKHWKKSEILQEALQCLAINYEQAERRWRYVCFALDEVAQGHPNTGIQVQEIKLYINELLVVGNYECDCYEEWLSMAHGITPEEKSTPEGINKLQYSRKQWMLWMIKHFKQQGD